MLLEQIQATLSGAGLPGGARCVAVAVSGGADSTAAAIALHRLWSPLGIRLALIHVDHTLPEAESPHDTEFVRALAERLGAAFANRVVDVRPEMAASGESLEMAARRLRHAALHDAAAESGADLLALGHNADDQIETLLLRLARGTGPRGLGGMAPAEPPPHGGPRIIRPLLDCPRADIRDWLRAEGIAWLDDPTNDADDVQRNRIRHHVLPALFDALGHAARDGILRTMALLRDEQREWLSHAERAALNAARRKSHAEFAENAETFPPPPSERGVAQSAGGSTPCRAPASVPSVRDSVAASVGNPCYPCHPCETIAPEARAPASALHCPTLASLPRPLARRVCLLAMQEADVPAALQTFAAIERIRALADGPARGTIRLDLGAGFIAERVYDALRIVAPASSSLSHFPSHLQAQPASGFVRPSRGNPLARPATASVSRDAVPDPALLRVRPLRAGDRMTPLGAAGSRTIADILVDRKVPIADRPFIEVVCLGERIVWLPGHAVDTAFAVSSADAPSWTLTLLSKGGMA